MLRNPSSDHASEQETVPAPGATEVVEGDSAEQALERVYERLGSQATIVDARRVRRGGIGGFFTREVVQMHVAPEDAPTSGATHARDTSPAGAAATGTAAGPPAGRAATNGDEVGEYTVPGRNPIDRVLAGALEAGDEVDFATYLHQQLSQERTVTPTAPAATTAGPRVTPVVWPAAAPSNLGGETATAAPGAHVAEPVAAPAEEVAAPTAPAGAAAGPAAPVTVAAPVAAADPTLAAAPTPSPARVVEPAPDLPPESAPGGSVRAGDPDECAGTPDDGGPRWSSTTLLRLGLPGELVRSIDLVEPWDDVSWTYGLASALRPLCRPLPTGRSLLIGPRARALAKARGVSVVRVGEPVRVRGDAAAALGGGAAGDDWLRKVRGGRWLHLVAGGERWRDLLHTDPLAISWAGPEDLTEAVRCAYELGLVLGHGPLAGGVLRARPLDVALGLRELVPRS